MEEDRRLANNCSAGVLPGVHLHCFVRGGQVCAAVTVKMKLLEHVGVDDTIYAHARGERAGGGAGDLDTCPGSKLRGLHNGMVETTRQKVVLSLRRQRGSSLRQQSCALSRAELRHRRAETLQRGGAGVDETCPGKAKVEVWTMEWWKRFARKWSSR